MQYKLKKGNKIEQTLKESKMTENFKVFRENGH